MKASILCRVSTKDKSEQEQEPESREYVKNNGWNLFKVYYEKGSAYKLHFDEREVFQQMLKEAKINNVKHFVFWNMDRYSRLEEEVVFEYTAKLSNLYGIQVHAVHGDSWSDLVESISKMKDLGFVGEALSEFVEKIIKGMEFRRAHRESKVKSQRVKLKVIKKEGEQTKSSYGNKWGRPKTEIDYSTKLKIKHDLKYLSIRSISEKYKIKKNQVEKIKKELSENTPL